MLTFPGVFTPDGLLGAGLQTTTWLYTLWHAGFPLFVIAYALLKDADPAEGLWQGSAGVAILSSVAVTAAVVCAATFLVTAGNDLLPRQSLDPVHFSTVWLYVAGYLALLIVVALIVLWIRRRSILDLWLMVVMSAYLIEIYLISFPEPVRYSIGWYAGRVFGLVSGSLVLFVLLYENNDALRAAAPRGPRPTPRARGAADNRGCGCGHHRPRSQAAVVRDDHQRRCGLALA